MTEPTNEQIANVAQAFEGEEVFVGFRDEAGDDDSALGTLDRDSRNDLAHALLTSTDPDVWDALAAHIPLDALARVGRLEVDGPVDRPVMGPCEDPTHTHGGLVDDPTPRLHIVCQTCFALVTHMDTAAHRDWHEQHQQQQEVQE